MGKKAKSSIPVSTLKNKLLEIVRKVEKGASFEITKGNLPVAMLVPLPVGTTSVINFAKVTINGDIVKPLKSEWSFDLDNLKVDE